MGNPWTTVAHGRQTVSSATWLSMSATYLHWLHRSHICYADNHFPRSLMSPLPTSRNSNELTRSSPLHTLRPPLILLLQCSKPLPRSTVMIISLANPLILL